MRDITGLRYAVEQAQIAVVAGEPRGKEDFVRLGRMLARKEAILRAAKAARVERKLTIPEYLAARDAGRGQP